MTTLIDKTFTKVAPKDIIIRFKKIELDLGDVWFNDLDLDLPYLLETKLTKLLEEKIIGARYLRSKNNPDVEVIVPYMAALEVLLLYLKTGILPWWVESTIAKFEGFGETLTL